MNIPAIATERLVLRPFTMDDVDPLHEIVQQPDIMRYFPPQPRPANPPLREAIERLINGQLKDWERNGYAWWAVELKDKLRLLGWCGLGYLSETDETEVAYLLRQEVWGQGLATEAAKASLAWGFQTFQFDAIIGLIHPDNIASQRVLEKCGLTFVERKDYFGMECCRYVLYRLQTADSRSRAAIEEK
ncbi:MAG: GNAT family N-acetyltransferase [Anaerolineae bacterium]|nr:GNAT family N-acetyltransferase [Anaerolineae bacterium]